LGGGFAEDIVVPKLKSHRGASKRFKITGTGKVRRGHSGARHILTSKTSKQKRRLRKATTVSPGMQKVLKQILDV
jgi:large subunit ribosomal protein L35